MFLFGNKGYEEGPSVGQLKMAEYVARHREVGRRAVQFSLFFADVLILSALVYVYITFVEGVPAQYMLENSLSYTYINVQEYHRTHRAVPLEVVETAVIATGEGKGDIVAWVRNPNQKWAAREVQYEFVAGALRISGDFTFLLPGETRIVTAFRQPLVAAEALRGEVKNVSWRRADMSLRDQVAGVTADGFRYTSFENGATGLDFSLHNDTPYSFWSVPVTVVARDGAKVVGAQRVSVERLQSGETRPVRVSWAETLPRVHTTMADVAIDVFDPSVFMPLEGEGASYPGF